MSNPNDAWPDDTPEWLVAICPVLWWIAVVACFAVGLSLFLAGTELGDWDTIRLSFAPLVVAALFIAFRP